MHNFFVSKTQKVTTLKCAKLADIDSDESINFVNRSRTGQDIQDEMCFKFKASIIKDCFESYGTPETVLQIDTIPKLPDNVIDQIKTEFNYIEATWKVCLPAAVVQNDLPDDKQTSFIFSAFFKKGATDQEPEKVSYINTVYHVSLVNYIQVDMDFFRDIVETGGDSGGPLWINAKDSKFIDVKHRDQILQYRWECSGNLKEFCQRRQGSPFLYISKSFREKNIALDEYYTIKLLVNGLKAAGSSPASTSPFIFA